MRIEIDIIDYIYNYIYIYVHTVLNSNHCEYSVMLYTTLFVAEIRHSEVASMEDSRGGLAHLVWIPM